ncbi:unnamed protein product [Prunus armeniaca]|uniref:Uncharacterized protein n=1 Tax=Prunus armeniaca TaxID=36596 RepID=A0A6J5WEB8_PRUAR|nr:unnamed protein product [Prunus armeniaca]CAB4300110.1 unnamed protein product [Prunus armeniaca]
MVVHNGHPHVLVPKVAIILAKKHNLVLVSEPIVGDGDMGRSASNIEKTVLALVKCIVVYPNLMLLPTLLHLHQPALLVLSFLLDP